MYISFLSCNSNLGSCCSDPGLAAILNSARNIISIIQIIAPLLLLIVASIEFTKSMVNPERKAGLKRIQNMFVSAAVVFFVPIIVDAFLGILPADFQLSDCWQQAKTMGESSRKLDAEYVSPYEQEGRHSILVNPDEYQKGTPKPSPSGGGTPGGETPPGGGDIGGSTPAIAPGDVSGILGGAEKVHTMYEQNGWAYYSNLNQLRWGDIKYSTNNPSRMTCCATFVGSALYIGGVFSESEINKFNYNSQYGISDLCKAHGWTQINSYSQLAAGDIVIMSGPNGGSAPGHVQIYAGNGTWYNAGSTSSIQRDSPYAGDASARFLWAWRKTS